MGEAKRRAFYRIHQQLVAEARAAREKRSEAARKGVATKAAKAEAAKLRSERSKKAAETVRQRRLSTQVAELRA